MDSRTVQEPPSNSVSSVRTGGGGERPRSRPAFTGPVRDGLLVGLALLSITSLATSLLYHRVEGALREEVHEHLLRLTHAAASLVDGDLHRTLVSPDQYGSETYNRILRPLRKLLQATPDTKYVYTAVLRNDKVYFGVDAALPIDTDGDGVIDQSGLFEVYNDADPWLYVALRENRAVVTPEPYTDKWGSFISGYVPFYDSVGEQIGVVCVDITTAHYKQRVSAVQHAATIAMIPTMILSLLGGWTCYWLRRAEAYRTGRQRARAARNLRQTEVVTAIATSPAVASGDLFSLARDLTEQAAATLDVERVGIWLFDPSETELRCIDTYEATRDRHTSGMVLCEQGFRAEFDALKASKFVAVDDALTDPRTAGYVETYVKPLNITSALDAVISSSGRNLGILCFEHVNRPHHWEADEITCACRLADQVALAVANGQRRQAEKAIRDSEERFRLACQSMTDVTWEWNIGNGRITWFGDIDRLLEYDKGEFPRTIEAWEAALHPEDRDRVMSALNRHLMTGEPYVQEYRVQAKDGSIRSWLDRGTAVRDTDGKAIEMIGTCADITERKQAEAKLRDRMNEVERFNRMALRREGRIIELKRKINELSSQLGRPPPYSIDNSDDDHPEDEDQMAPTWEACGPSLPVIQQTEPMELADLIDLDQMQRLLDSFCAAVGIAAAIIDLQGNILVGSHWRRICTDFHRVHPCARERCIESDTQLANRLKAGELLTVYRCRNGLMDAASPIVINGRHLANAFVGQFLLEPADEEMFRRQAVEFGFDETEYLRSLSEVPVVSQDQFSFVLDFLVTFAQLTAANGLKHLQQLQTEARLAQHAAELDARNRESDRQREAALNLAEDAELARIAAEKSEAGLRESERRFRTVVSAARDAIIVMGAQEEVTIWSPGAEAMFGWTAEEAVGRKVHELLAPPRYHEAQAKASAIFHATGRGAVVGNTIELPAMHKDGHEFPVELSLSALDLEGSWGSVGILRDITDRKRMEEELRTAARTDKLTGLPNRAFFLDHLQHALLRADRFKDYRYAVLFLDFDRFKIINDSLGHKAGDLLLQEAAARLRAAVRAGDALGRQDCEQTTARLGGDEFVVLLDGLRETADAQVVAQRLLQHFSQPYQLGEHEVYCTASIGIVTSDTPATSAEDVLRDADTAMYEAKVAGKGRYASFDVSMRQRVQNRLNLENDLRKAIDTQQLFVMYQPIVSLDTMAIEAFEALIRWNHPERGSIPPADFVPIAEDTGLIVPLGEWILGEACRQFALWRQDQGDTAPYYISVNLSRSQLLVWDLPTMIQRVLRETGLPPANLQLEVTESTIMRDAELAQRVLKALKDVGVMLAMDDFGTGYSSLSCLHQFPFDVLKIDRSFIANLDRGRDMTALVHAVVALARNLNIRVVAEGIETAEQLMTLQSLGCQFGQGYFFSKPMMTADAAHFRVQTAVLPGAVSSP